MIDDFWPEFSGHNSLGCLGGQPSGNLYLQMIDEFWPEFSGHNSLGCSGGQPSSVNIQFLLQRTLSVGNGAATSIFYLGGINEYRYLLINIFFLSYFLYVYILFS